jgi:hypothetical protein
MLRHSASNCSRTRAPSAEKRVERAFVDLQAVVGEGFAQSVAVLLPAQGGENGEDYGAASEFEPEVLKSFLGHVCTVSYIVCHTYCVIHSSKCQGIFLSSKFRVLSSEFRDYGLRELGGGNKE